MSTFVVTNAELYEIIKKGNFEPSKKVMKLIKQAVEEQKKMLMNQLQKTKLKSLLHYLRKHSQKRQEIEFDSEDGVVQGIINKIVLRIKDKLNNSTDTNGAGIRLLRLMFGFIEQFVRKDKSDGEDKSSPTAETSKH